MDTNNSGEIEYTEFISATIEKNIYLNENKLKEAFKYFDLDGNGKINREEIIKILKVTKSSKELNKIMEENDINKDGELDFNEFLKMIKNFT
jgi:calcium-dependent protein kinase